MNQLKLECGITLELQPVQSMLLLDLLESMKMGKDGKMDIKSMSIRDLNRLMKYLCRQPPTPIRTEAPSRNRPRIRRQASLAP